MRSYRRLAPGLCAAVAAVAALATCLIASTPASAVPRRAAPHVRHLTDVAGRSPFTGRHCNVATPYYTSPGGKEGEPFVAVDPTHPRNRVVAYMDAARATVDVAYTRNSGHSWQRSIPRGVDGCTGNHRNTWEASGDPWVSIGPDGTSYLSALTWAHFVTPPTSRYVSLVHVQTSTNGGRSWSAPVDLAGQNAVSDKPMVLANPYHAGVAYVIWRNQGFGLATGRRAATRLLFASTHDAGRTWSRPVVIERGSASDFFGSPQLSVLRSGTLVATSSLADAGGGNDLLSWRSTDGGRRWSGRTLVDNIPDGSNPAFCGQSAAGGDTGSSAGQQTVVRGKSVLFVYLDGAAAAAGRGRLMMARSDDGGRTWGTHTVLRSADPLLLASVTANRHGELALLWDSARIDCDASTIPTQSLFATLPAGGSDWTSPIAIGPWWWNLATSARGTGGFSGYFIGDYQALASTARGFTTVTVQGPSLTRRHRPRIVGATGVVVADLDVAKQAG